MSAQKGDVLVIPGPVPAAPRVTIKWSQLGSRTADYVPLVVQNKSQGNADVPIFIEVEWYTEAYLAGVAHKNESGAYELTIDDKFQYGQKNGGGEHRFVVFHDKSRKPYHLRFLDTALASTTPGLAAKVAGALGYMSAANAVARSADAFIGEYLRTF
ncbi:hypothetical protein FA95DRAFT_1026770 [Auriscalpium vulgare]|uniref:Uncharacterized protein n=1 Tax=Auriscalpium vulgare TaxID=40419 RepID=A0ACB8RWK0_9AGAM|nr:hypothetical protein FA95DRAFT_1026770 [Auriscalpium vulgare]